MTLILIFTTKTHYVTYTGTSEDLVKYLNFDKGDSSTSRNQKARKIFSEVQDIKCNGRWNLGEDSELSKRHHYLK